MLSMNYRIHLNIFTKKWNFPKNSWTFRAKVDFSLLHKFWQILAKIFICVWNSLRTYNWNFEIFLVYSKNKFKSNWRILCPDYFLYSFDFPSSRLLWGWIIFRFDRFQNGVKFVFLFLFLEKFVKMCRRHPLKKGNIAGYDWTSDLLENIETFCLKKDKC